jgi:hypothetical protein
MNPLRTTRQGVPGLFLGAMVLAILLMPYSAQATSKFWVGDSGLWNDPNNWSNLPGGAGGAGPPQDGDGAYLIQNDDVIRIVTYKNDHPAVIAPLVINATGTSGIILYQGVYDDLLNSTVEYVGGYLAGSELVSGKGIHVQSGGSNITPRLTLGNTSDSSGTYALSGGSLEPGVLTVGDRGTGTFTHTGGTNTVSHLYVGVLSYASGTYALSGIGMLSAHDQYIGYGGTGHFNQTGGSNTVSGSISLGQNPGSSGTYELNGGSLSVHSLFVGWEGDGEFTHDKGTNTVANLLYVGCGSASNGVYSLGSSAVSRGELTSQEQIIGLSGTGTFNHSYGTNTVSDRLILGRNQFSSGTYFLGYQGELEAGSQYIGWYGTGLFRQLWGTNTVKGDLYLGYKSTGSGTYELISDSWLYATNQYIGYEGAGHFTQTGGYNRIYNKLFLAWSSGSVGTYILDGGLLRIDGGMEVGSGGTFTQTGGALNSGPLNNAGTVNFFEGTVSVGHITNYSFGTLNISTDLTLGSANNYGTIKTTGATVIWQGKFYNAGAYISDPSKQTFETDLEVAPPGYLVGYSQDLFVVKGDLKVQSTQNLLWKTDQAVLQFVGVDNDNDHNFWIPGEDRGPGGGADNFKWGTLILGDLDEAGRIINRQIVHILDGNPENLGSALYLGKIEGLDYDPTTLMVANLIGFEGLNVYYDPACNDYLGGLTYYLKDGGRLTPTPVPASALLLGSGLLGLAFLGWRRNRG